MSQLAEFLARHGLMLLAGASALLSAGAIAAALQRWPVQRQRLGEAAIAGTLLWIALACAPLPRWGDAAPATALASTAHHPPSIILSTSEMAALRRLVGVLPDDAHPTAQSQTTLAAVAPVSDRATSGVEPALTALPVSNLPRQVSWSSLVARLYLTGAGLCLGWLLLGHVLLWRLTRRAGDTPAWLVELFASATAECGVKRAELRVCARPTRPLSCGILRPLVLVSADLATVANSARLRQVFRHELAHLARRDALGSALFNAALPLLYGHPLYWWLRHRTWLARELVADERAAAATSRITYASDLLAMARNSGPANRGPLAAVGMFQFTNDLSRRILMLVQTREPFPVRCSRSWRIATLGGSAIALLLACGTLGLRPAHVQAAEPSDREPADTTSAPGRETTPADRPDGARTEGQPDTASAPARETTPADRPDGARTDDPNAERREAADQGHTTADPTADRPDLEGEHRNVTRESDDLHSAQTRMRDWLRSRPAGRPSTAQELADDDASNPSTRMRGRPGQEVAPALSGAGGAAHAGLDLVSLANTYLDALGQERVAAARASVTRSDSGPRDEAIAHAELANAQAKVRLLRRIIEVATQQANSELQRLQQLYRTGAVSSADLTDADTRAKILRLILEGGDNTAPREARPGNHIESRP